MWLLLNLLAFIWYILTTISGIFAYERGDSFTGVFAWWGNTFDTLFGIQRGDECKLVKSGNQKPPFRSACFTCPSTQYPLGFNKGNVIVEPYFNDADCTVVDGVGGFIAHGGKAVNPWNYIQEFWSGDQTQPGTLTNYNKKLFKAGVSPFLLENKPLKDGTTGYYYTTDHAGKEIPIIPPTTSSSSTPVHYNLSDYGSDPSNGGYPTGWLAWISSGILPQMSFNGLSMSNNNKSFGYSGYSSSTTGISPINGFQTRSVSGSKNSPMNSNIYYAQTAAGKRTGIHFKSFPPLPSPSQWSKQ